MVNVGTNTEKQKSCVDFSSLRSPSSKLQERDVKHTKIINIKELSSFYNYGEKLGKGVFGTVVEVTDKATKQIWALKIVDRKNMIKGTKINTIENEMKILRMVNHPHIIHLERSFESHTHIYLVIERCTTELASILREKKVFTEAETQKVLEHLSSAVAYLHKHDIVHRDLKMENILTAPNPCDPNDNLYIKVSDFGLGIIRSVNRLDQMLRGKCGTLTYMAPEIISRSSYSQQCDIWAMGVICYLLLTGNFPFYSTAETELMFLICNYDPIRPEFTVSDQALHVISKMLEKNPALRISATEVNRHPWISGEKMDHTKPTYNVLDMMQLWRSEMMVRPENETVNSDWANAFSNLEKSFNGIENDANKNIPENDKSSNTTTMMQEMSDEYKKIRISQFDNGKRTCPRALNVKGRNTKLIRIGKTK